MTSPSGVRLPDAHHPETSFGLLRMGLALRGLASGRLDGAPRVLLLGGAFSAALYAAAAPGEYWYLDDDPACGLRAGELARAAGATLHVSNRSLAETAEDDGLPEFDLIVAHDVWSMAGQNGRRHILRLLDRRLAAGGVACLSYAALPGWFAASGPRDLAALLARSGKGAPLALMGRLTDIPAGFLHRNPEAGALVRAVREAPGLPACFLPDWKPFHFAEVVEALASVRLDWGGPALLLDGLDAVNIPAEAVPLLEEQDDPVLRESLRDYVLNRNRRCDVFVKGARRLNRRERDAAVGALRLGLTRPVEAVPRSFATPLGSCALQGDVYDPVLAALADGGYAAKSVEELEDHPLLAAMDSVTLLEALTVLAGLGAIHPARATAEARTRCHALNMRLLGEARAGEGTPCLASPVLGAGVAVDGPDQLFLASFAGAGAAGGETGGATPREWAEDAWAVLAGQGRTLTKDGAALSYEQAEDEMTALAERFAAERLPVLRALDVVPGAVTKTGENHA